MIVVLGKYKWQNVHRLRVDYLGRHVDCMPADWVTRPSCHRSKVTASKTDLYVKRSSDLLFEPLLLQFCFSIVCWLPEKSMRMSRFTILNTHLPLVPVIGELMAELILIEMVTNIAIIGAHLLPPSVLVITHICLSIADSDIWFILNVFSFEWI